MPLLRWGMYRVLVPEHRSFTFLARVIIALYLKFIVLFISNRASGIPSGDLMRQGKPPRSNFGKSSTSAPKDSGTLTSANSRQRISIRASVTRKSAKRRNTIYTRLTRERERARRALGTLGARYGIASFSNALANADTGKRGNAESPSAANISFSRTRSATDTSPA